MAAVNGQTEGLADKLFKQLFFAQALHRGAVLGQMQHQALAVGRQTAGH